MFDHAVLRSRIRYSKYAGENDNNDDLGLPEYTDISQRNGADECDMRWMNEWGG